MLNLSDKELDRLSQEAAQEHDPGDILGPRSWDKLEPQLDRDLGRASPNPLKGVRRFPYYYAPAILLVAGIFYFATQNYTTRNGEPSGSPPSVSSQANPASTSQTPSSSQNPDHRKNSTSPVTSNALTDQNATNEQSGESEAASTDKNQNDGLTTHSGANPNPSGATSSSKPNPNPSGTPSSANSNPAGAAPSSGSRSSSSTKSRGFTPSSKTSGPTSSSNAPKTSGSRPRSKVPTTSNSSLAKKPGRQTTAAASDAAAAAGSTALVLITGSDKPAAPHELSLSAVRGPQPIKKSPVISDSALRAYTAKTPPSTIQPGKNKSLRINRSLQFGLSVAPDFSSVNSMAGDKPGSSIGITLDYQFANRWYISTGLFLDRKNYAAREQDYHVPYDYYQLNNLHNVDFVKGSFNMLEIPLNLRYDFSVAGNTLFFASTGLSSYLLTDENCNYYYNMFGQENCKNFKYSNGGNYLFSSVNLSLGVETGIGNSLSLLVAPYIKIPSRNIGFGHMQMNSVGINFALKFAPVLSRRRK